MRIKVKIPNHDTKNNEEFSELYRQYLTAYAILDVVIPTSKGVLFSKNHIESICLKGIKKEKTVTPKQNTLLALLFVLKKNGLKCYKDDDILENSKKVFGYQFTEKAQDISVWLTDISEYIVRDKKQNTISLLPNFEQLILAAFRNGYFNQTIIIGDKDLEVTVKEKTT
jgi:hypothetical protein